MRGYEIPDGVGHACGEALGLDAFVALGHGQDGKVFALEDGRVLKVTLSPFEAACCQFIMEAGASAPALFPRVNHVARLDIDGAAAFAIVREDAHDVVMAMDEADEADLRTWTAVAHHLAYAWSNRAPWVAGTAREMAGRGLPVDHVLPGLEWFERGTGCRLADLKPCAFGVAGGGRLVLRDLSRSEDAYSSFLVPTLARVPDLPAVAPVMAP